MSTTAATMDLPFGSTEKSRRCTGCGAPLDGRRVDAETCSAACRKRRSRKTEPAAVKRDDKFKSRDVTDTGSWVGREIYEVNFGSFGNRLPGVKVHKVLADDANFVYLEVRPWDFGTSIDPVKLLHTANALPKAELLATGYVHGCDADTWYLQRERAEDEIERSLRYRAFETARKAQEEAEQAKRREQYKRHEAGGRADAKVYPDFDTSDAFRTLGITWPCTEEAVRKAYRERAKLVHPDKGGTSEAFVELKKAFDLALALCQAGRKKGKPK